MAKTLIGNIKGPKGDTGNTGATGSTGPAGPAGPGVPNGGNTGDMLVKNSATNQDTKWIAPGTITEIVNLQNALGIVVNGKQAAVNAATEQYVILKNSTITDRTDGLYTAAKPISANTDIDKTYLTAVSNGGLNSLNDRIAKQDYNLVGATTYSDNVFSAAPGIYRCLSTASNIPVVSNGYLFVIKRADDTKYLQFMTDSGRMFTNTNNGTSWTGWNELATENSVNQKKSIQTAVANPDATGSSINFIDSISQNAQGVISPTRKKVRTMNGATSSESGLEGLVPTPGVGDRNKYLRGDASWQNPVASSQLSDAGIPSSVSVTKSGNIVIVTFSGTTYGDAIYTLPSGWRPVYETARSVLKSASGSEVCRVSISTAGVIDLVGGTGTNATTYYGECVFII